MEAKEVGTISEEEGGGGGDLGEFFTRHSLSVTMRSSSKRNKRKTQLEAAREKRQGDPVFNEKVEESEILFRNTEWPTDHPSPVPRSPPGSPSRSAYLQYEDVLDMVQRLRKELGLITLDNDKIRTVCNQLLEDNQARDRAIGDLTGLVRTGSEEFGSSGDTATSTGGHTTTPHHPTGPH